MHLFCLAFPQVCCSVTIFIMDNIVEFWRILLGESSIIVIEDHMNLLIWVLDD